ncbi:MAG: LamG domain-containing protein [Planctomycetota bacterium]
MCRKLSFLVALVLVLALDGSANAIAPTTDLDVNNFSFELDADGNQECGHTGNDLGIGWTLGNVNWVGQDVNCAYPGFCMDCDPDNPESEGGNCNCKVWDASHGVIMCYMQTNDTWFEQFLTDTIEARKQYTLKFDAMTWDTGVVFRSSIMYDDGGGPGSGEVAGKNITLEETVDANLVEWKEYKVVLVIPDGHPALGSPIGIRWECTKLNGGAGRWPFIDYIRVTSQPATDAWGPNPDDEEINVDLKLEKLTWGAGLWAKKHNVYFGTNWADVNSRDAGTLIATQQDANEVNVPIELVIGGEYFWAVDEYNDTYVQGVNDPPMPPWTGPVWSFNTNDGKAYDFSPGNEAEDIAIDVNLSWTPGVVVDVHNVYFSTSFDDVNSRAQDANQGHQGPNTFDPTPTGVLALAQTYYWAVDEVNAGTVGSPWQSDVLEFTTIDHVVVDDFNSYENQAALWNVWKDYWTNGTGAEVFPEADANFVEDGNALKYRYDNATGFYGYYSEAYADITDLGIDPNWTTNGVKALRLAFMGEAGNALDDMYVTLTDSSNHTGKVLYPDSNELTEEWKGFQEWNIDLQNFVDDNSVDLTSISRLTIGFGDKTPGGTGTVYFDNIRLHPPRCVLNNAFAGGSIDFDEDCLVDNADLDVFTQRDWLISAVGNITATPPDANFLTGWWRLDDNVKSGPGLRDVVDSSAYGNHGLLYDIDKAPGNNTAAHQDPCYVEGTGAFTFDGYDDFVNLPALDLNSNTVTISTWLKRDGDLEIYAGIVDCHYSDPCDSNLATFAGLDFGSGGEFGFAEWAPWQVNHELAYFWTIDATSVPFTWSYDFHTGLIVPDQQWVLATLAIEPTKGTVYMYDGELKAAINNVPHYKELWNGRARLGDQIQNPNRLFKGTMDDVRIYSYSLTPEEVLYMALQGPGSQYIKLPWWRADLDDDNTINFEDYGLMADNWLKELFWP